MNPSTRPSTTPFPIPVRSIGPGSQPEEDATLDVMPLPHEMHTFEMPRVPEKVPAEVLQAAREWLRGLLQGFEGWDPARQPQGPRASLQGLPPPVLAVVNELLGEGEVSIRVAAGPARPEVHVQEAAFNGLWRGCEVGAQGELLAAWVEAASVPREVLQAAAEPDSEVRDPMPFPDGVMNAPALLEEIRQRLPSVAALPPHQAAAQLNLTLLPLSPQDHEVLRSVLPPGPVSMISRGFGNCHVTATTARHVWRVQYFNSMKTMILDTLEVVALPEVAIAGVDDLHDTRERLTELLQWLDEDLGVA